ncbi:MAG: carboxypeptidase regulatory-like domain-containing protein [Saprospiraceae bacterium]|nr:carboxypeptidase regulatory-like domain-containing protein [Saprospiraceae bacterium]
MSRNLLLIIILLASTFTAFAQNVGTLQGKITDAETGEPIIFGPVTLFKGGAQAAVVQTDIDGNYSVANLDPGDYNVEISYVGYQTQMIEGVRIFAGKVVPLNVKISAGVLLEGVEIVAYKVPLIEQDNTTQGRTITSEDIKALPLKDINSIASSTAGISSIDNEAVSVRGSRSNATDYYIDGVRVRGAMVPQFEIEQLQVITGGIEAIYGDVTGGVISVTTKGPSPTFGGGAEVETSKFLDAFGYSEVNLNLSGPIIKRDNKSLLGFRVSGRYRVREEDNPGALGYYRAPESLIRDLEANPLGLADGTPYARIGSITTDQMELLDARPNETEKFTDLTGRLDARLSDAIDVSLSGSYRSGTNLFGFSNNSNVNAERFNWTRNPTNVTQSFRTNFRLRHRLGGSNFSQNAEEGAKKSSTIQNAAYVIQLGFERGFSSAQDPIHKDNLFSYGYIGKFDYVWQPVPGELPSPLDFGHAGWTRTLEGAYTPGSNNPVLANYNNVLTAEQLANSDNYIATNGFVSDAFTSAWSFNSNVGAVYNSYFKTENNVFNANATLNFDFLPGGSEKGRHSIQFGLLHEQRVDRSYSVAPFRLYDIARLQSNIHINGVDTSAIIGTFIFNDVEYPEYDKLIVEPSGSRFYRSVRERFNVPLNQHFNVDGINPNDLSLDLFSPNELTDQGIIDFSGYDYLGNKVDRNASFNDFFTAKDRDGNRQFLVAPNQPIYSAIFLQDKFTFKDIIFRLGVRVDRYDANTKILKDQYSLYDIMTADDFYNQFGGNRPNNVGDDFKVYVDGDGSTSVRAFRQGDQWYDAAGSPVNDGVLIWGSELSTPKFYDDLINNIKDDRFSPDRSFVDYEPQINVMPRIAVSFPISDEANFFAHYDILVQRPPSNAFESALGYYYFEDFVSGQGNPRNNPALKPERTIDYEVGFQQRLSSSSAIKMSAFYRELRDMIQIRQILYAAPPVNTYATYDNLDFGTVKGFQFQYELRRTRNISLVLNYTLQFADGTGSDANSQSGISQRGNLRTLFPLSRDERHALKGVFDFRYDSGKRYNGPRLFGKDILANSGLNLQFNAISGRPYTRRQRATAFGGNGFEGSINGARLPWNYAMDVRVEKSFRLNSPEAAKPLNMTLSLRVLNLFDARNVRGVYSVTGSPEDSGFLSSSDGAAVVRQADSGGAALVAAGVNSQAYLDSYSWSNLQNGFYSLPRRIFLAALFDF